jgi:hypothetical protein
MRLVMETGSMTERLAVTEAPGAPVHCRSVLPRLLRQAFGVHDRGHGEDGAGGGAAARYLSARLTEAWAAAQRSTARVY